MPEGWAAQASLERFAISDEDLAQLTPAERKAYVAVRVNGAGVREHARATQRKPGTIGNLLSRAEGKLDEAD